jgi:hypothetical protein
LKRRGDGKILIAHHPHRHLGHLKIDALQGSRQARISALVRSVVEDVRTSVCQVASDVLSDKESMAA